MVVCCPKVIQGFVFAKWLCVEWKYWYGKMKHTLFSNHYGALDQGLMGCPNFFVIIICLFYCHFFFGIMNSSSQV
jgi:hypothetical protein